MDVSVDYVGMETISKIMKSVIIALIFALGVGFSMFAQDVQQEPLTQAETISEAERIIDKYSSKAVEAFSEAVTTITPIAVDAFKMVVRLQVAKGIGWLLIALASLSPFFFLKWSFNQHLKDREFNLNKYGAEKRETGGILLGINILLCISGFISFCVFIQPALLYLIAPEWYAVKEILNLF